MAEASVRLAITMVPIVVAVVLTLLPEAVGVATVGATIVIRKFKGVTVVAVVLVAIGVAGVAVGEARGGAIGVSVLV